jgi:hypothetical protein
MKAQAAAQFAFNKLSPVQWRQIHAKLKDLIANLCEGNSAGDLAFVTGARRALEVHARRGTARRGGFCATAQNPRPLRDRHGLGPPARRGQGDGRHRHQWLHHRRGTSRD